MSFRNIAETIPAEKRQTVSDKLSDIILSSKNDDRMPNDLANTILHLWQRNLLSAEHGLATLLEAATLLESEKAIASLTELGLPDVAEQVKQTATRS